MAHKFLPDNRKLLDYEGKSISPANEESYPFQVWILYSLCLFVPGQITFSHCRKSLSGFFYI